MALAPQKKREIVLQLLYSEEMGGGMDEEMIELLMTELKVSKSAIRSSLEQKAAIRLQQAELDALIATHSQAYELHRIPLVERNILRLALYEMHQVPPLPAPVIIAEGIRLARKFATPEAAHFINAILDACRFQLVAIP